MEEGGAALSYLRERVGDQQDCMYFMRTGTCGYGHKCRYNHPVNRGLMGFNFCNGNDLQTSGKAKTEYPERPGQPECPYYLRTGTCKFGATCKFHHDPRVKPASSLATPRGVAMNGLGYPLRPGEKECAFYMRTHQCKYGKSCKYHHPHLYAGGFNLLNNLGPGMIGASSAAGTGGEGLAGTVPTGLVPVTQVGSNPRLPVPISPLQSNWHVRPLTRFPLFSGSQPPPVQAPGQTPYLIQQHPSGGIVFLPPGWNYQYIASTQADASSSSYSHPYSSQPIVSRTQSMTNHQIQNSVASQHALPTTATGAPFFFAQASTSSTSANEQLTGGARSGATVAVGPSFAAPTGSVGQHLNDFSTAASTGLHGIANLQSVVAAGNNPMMVLLQQQQQRMDDFPERAGQPECRYYMRTGDCKFGMTCRFHHPKDRGAGTAQCALSVMGLPLRPGQPQCVFYNRHGYCKFGHTCKFDHPMGELEYCPSSSSLVDSDMPVAPMPYQSMGMIDGYSGADVVQQLDGETATTAGGAKLKDGHSAAINGHQGHDGNSKHEVEDGMTVKGTAAAMAMASASDVVGNGGPEQG